MYFRGSEPDGFWNPRDWLAILSGMSDVTRILSQVEAGDAQAAGQLLPLVYGELRRLAAAKLAHEKPGQTLSATALVHEAYLRLVGGQGTGSQEPGASAATSGDETLLPPGPRPLDSVSWNSRGHFFAAAAEAMRRILVESARRKQTLKRGGGEKRVDLELVDSLVIDDETLDLVALDEALTRLAQQQPVKAELVKLRFFAGLTMREAAEALGISLATAERHWTFARTWLLAELSRD